MFQAVTSNQFLRRNESYTLFSLTFISRPLGFEVHPSRDSKNMVITSISEKCHMDNGLRVGSSIAEINGKYCANQSVSKILQLVKTQPLPLQILFKQDLVDIEIHEKPFGICLQPSAIGNDVMVSSIYQQKHEKHGLHVGCFVYKVGNHFIHELSYFSVISLIIKQPLPFSITFRKVCTFFT